MTEREEKERQRIPPYPETHQVGVLLIEEDIKAGAHTGDLGIQVASDGRIWICFNGRSLMRFSKSLMEYTERT